MSTERAQWKSRFGFILAAAGSAIGLGNIWKFPYITGENGGGLFVLIYLVCIALVGIPIMMAEIMIGRAAQKQPVGAFETLQGHKTAWSGIGWLGVVAGFIILSYYAVVAGWAMDFTLKSVVNFTKGIHDKAQVEAEQYVATTSIDEMRGMLTARAIAHETAPLVQELRSSVLPSVWKDYDRIQSVIADMEDPSEARARLLLDEELKAHMETAEGIMATISEKTAEVEQRIGAEFAAMGDADIVRKAQEAQRRSLTFDSTKAAFLATATDGWTSLFWAALFMLITILIVAAGVSGGIERACGILMPTLFLMLVGMVIYGAFQPGFGRALDFVFRPDVSKLKPSGVLEALGHSFFTLSLGMGAMITYGSYQSKKEGLFGESVMIALLDTLVALLACLMIFPITFSYGQEPSAGPGLVFMSMPLAFAEIGKGGMLLGIVFFGLLVFAALTSAISLLEVVASYFIDQKGWSRTKAAWIMGLVILGFGMPSAFAMHPTFAMSGWEAGYGVNFFDTMDYLASNWMLPIGGLFISFYAGWIMPRRLQEAEVQDMPPVVFQGWLLLVRIVAPVLVLVVIAQKVGILDADEVFFTLFH